MMYEPSSGMTNSTIALLEEPSRTVGMPRNWLLGLPSIHTRSKIVPTTWKLDVLLGPTLSTWSLTRSPALAGSGRLHAVVHAVEDDVGGLCRTHAVAVEHVQRGAVDLALARVELGIELALDDHVLTIRLGREAGARFHDDGAVHSRRDVLENHRRSAVVHEDAGVVEGELELDGLARRDGAIFVLRRHHGRVEVHRVHHRCGRHAHTGHGLVAAVRHLEADLVADACADRWSRHLVAEGPGGEFHARRDLDDLVGRIEADLLHRSRIERLQRRRHGQRVAGGEGAPLPRGGDPCRRRLWVQSRRVVWIGRCRLV